MLTRFSLILIFHKFKPIFRVIGLTAFLLFSCEEANYELDNPFDPENMDLEPIHFRLAEILEESSSGGVDHLHIDPNHLSGFV